MAARVFVRRRSNPALIHNAQPGATLARSSVNFYFFSFVTAAANAKKMTRQFFNLLCTVKFMRSN
jgi:hypothetical protein